MLEHENKKHDNDMLKLAWQTAYLMNSTGNFKKDIKPTDLYTSVFAVEEIEAEELTVEEAKQQREQLAAELLATFDKC